MDLFARNGYGHARDGRRVRRPVVGGSVALEDGRLDPKDNNETATESLTPCLRPSPPSGADPALHRRLDRRSTCRGSAPTDRLEVERYDDIENIKDDRTILTTASRSIFATWEWRSLRWRHLRRSGELVVL